MWKIKIKTDVKTNIFECKNENEVFGLAASIKYLESMGLCNIKLITAYEVVSGRMKNYITIIEKI